MNDEPPCPRTLLNPVGQAVELPPQQRRPSQQRRLQTRRSGAVKQIARKLACRLTGWTQREIGAYYGGISCAAVSVARRKIREGPTAQKNMIVQLLAELAEERSPLAKVNN